MLYKLSVCLLIKNESKNIEEFINHYINQGVDHFYIILNNNDDDIIEKINLSSYKSLITLMIDNSIMIENNILLFDTQKKIINDNFYDLVKKETEWAILVDCDEFMYGKNGYTIKTFLSTIDDDIGSIYVLWNTITPEKNNLSDKFSLTNNAYRINYDHLNELNSNILFSFDFGKSLFKTSMLTDNSKLWIHKINVSGKRITNYGNIDTNWYDNNNYIQYNEDKFNKLNITLDHYPIRDLNDYNKRVIKNNKFSNGVIDLLNLEKNSKYFVKVS